MYDACLDHFKDNDIAILAAAVADYTPTHVASEKIKKEGGELTISLTKTKDILRTLGEQKTGRSFWWDLLWKRTTKKCLPKKSCKRKRPILSFLIQCRTKVLPLGTIQIK